jgi:phage gpG-like protein
VKTFIQASRGVSPEEKATFHQVSGAGPKHVLRPFLGLTDAEEDEIARRLEPLIDSKVQQNF